MTCLNLNICKYHVLQVTFVEVSYEISKVLFICFILQVKNCVVYLL